MDKLDFVQTGGFPLKGERLKEMQDAYSIFNALGNIIGSKAIVSGCDVTGINTSDGVVFVNGEVIEFKGGATMSLVKIVEEPTSKEFQNGQVKVVHKKRYVTFTSTLSGSMLWSGFKRGLATSTLQALLDAKAAQAAVDTLATKVTELEAKTAVFQSGGGMVLWNKPAAQIPPGWAEVADWRGRMPIGWNPDDTDFDTLGDAGGAKTKGLTVDNLPDHFHYTAHDSFANGEPVVTASRTIAHKSANTPGGSDNYDMLMAGVLQEANVGKTSGTGGGQPINILNPYRVVMFIEWVGL